MNAEMSNKENKKVLDLIKNEYFVRWTIDPNEESHHFWAKWMNSNSERKADVEIARQIILSFNYKKSKTITETDYDSVLSNILEHSQQQHERTYSLHHGFLKYAELAAVFLLVLFLSAYGLSIQTTNVQVDSTIITKSTVAGQKLFIKLPDDSFITLNAESTLSYSLPFTDSRKVRLDGEAYFEVTKDPNRPFIVESGDVVTKVLGTTFNVRSYSWDKENTISVVEGKVSVSDNLGHEALLFPNNQGVFNLEHKQLLVGPFSVEKVLGWRNGLLIFENEPLMSVISKLERWYGVEFVFSNEMKLKGEYSGQYNNASLAKVLDGIGYASGFEYRIEGDRITINKITQ